MDPKRRANVTYVHDQTLSDVQPVEVEHTWEISNFRRRNGVLESTEFCSEFDKTLRWRLYLYPPSTVGESNTTGSLKLYNCGGMHGSSYRLEVSIIKRDGSIFCTKVDSWDRFNNELNYRNVQLIDQEALFDESNDLLFNDRLTIVSKISLTVYTENSTKRVDHSNFQISDSTILSDLLRLHDTQLGSDITLSMVDGELRAHKVILMLRSPVFAAMFNTEMKEKNTDRVTITDTSYNTMRQVLRFMYTGVRPSSYEVTTDLLVAADKYNLELLKEMCEHSLSSTVSTDSAAELLSLADRHNAKLLKSTAMGFVTKHCQAVMQTEGWKAVVEQEPQLFSEVTESMSKLIASSGIS